MIFRQAVLTVIDMKFYGYKNTKTNRLLGDTLHGEWVRVSFVRFVFLFLFRYMTKVEK